MLLLDFILLLHASKQYILTNTEYIYEYIHVWTTENN